MQNVRTPVGSVWSSTGAEPLEELAGRLGAPRRVGGETEPQYLFQLLGLRRIEPVP